MRSLPPLHREVGSAIDLDAEGTFFFKEAHFRMGLPGLPDEAFRIHKFVNIRSAPIILQIKRKGMSVTSSIGCQDHGVVYVYASDLHGLTINY